MSLETKIRELMEAKKAKAAQQLQEKTTASGLNAPDEAQAHQGSSEKASYTVLDPFTGQPAVGEDDTLNKGGAEAQAKQGSSEKASYQEVEAHKANVTTPDSSLKKGNSEPQHKQGDSRKAEYSEGGNNIHNGNTEAPTAPGGGVKAFEEEEFDGEVIAEEKPESKAHEKAEAKKEKRKVEMKLEDLRKDIGSLFAGDENLSEEFKAQAGSIFEAAVIARVNNEVEQIAEELQEQNVRDFEELKEGLVEKVDSYLGYVVEQWMKDNEVEVEKGLRAEVAEDFMLGLKNLFKEHYFEVPEDKVDVLEDMSAKVDEVTARLDESIQMNIELKQELDAIKRNSIIEHACKDLTATDAEKMGKLLEGVEFDNEELFSQKVAVVKENYFPANTPNSPEKMLEEQVSYGSDAKPAEVPSNMKHYAEALSRIAKAKK